METKSYGSEFTQLELLDITCMHVQKIEHGKRSHQPVLLTVLLAVADEHHRVVDIRLSLVASVEDAALVGAPAGCILQEGRDRSLEFPFSA